MGKIWVKDLLPGVKGQSLFLTLEVNEAVAKTGKPYLNVKFGDRTGDVTAKLFDATKDGCALVVGKPCNLEFKVDLYNGKPSVLLTSIIAPTVDADMSDFIKSSSYPVVEMWDKFDMYLSRFDSVYFSLVSNRLFSAEAVTKFKLAPAATGMHHAFVHGLLEHTVQMLECAEVLLNLPFFAKALNKDLCMFGIMFHDFGKIYEYSCEPGFKKTAQGVLVGHIPMVAAEIFSACGTFGVPEEIRDHMMHVVLAHHRFKEWGSPNTPACPEAAFVHYVDNLHGDTFGMIQAREAAQGDFASYGYGEQRTTVLKKTFNEILKECEVTTDGF